MSDNIWYTFTTLMGFRYLASSIPTTSLTGVAIGVGSISASLVLSMSRNPSISNNLTRWASIGLSSIYISININWNNIFYIIRRVDNR